MALLPVKGLNTLNPNSRLELYECGSVSAEVTVTRNSITKTSRQRRICLAGPTP